jgi:hypothetical protein
MSETDERIDGMKGADYSLIPTRGQNQPWSSYTTLPYGRLGRIHKIGRWTRIWITPKKCIFRTMGNFSLGSARDADCGECAQTHHQHARCISECASITTINAWFRPGDFECARRTSAASRLYGTASRHDCSAQTAAQKLFEKKWICVRA